MKNTILSLAALALCAPLWASAAEGFVVADISLQAGPDTQYPSIEELYAGTNVSIQGCLQGWTWCDVIASNGDRGWVPGTFIEETYNSQRVVVFDYGARIGIPVVSFSIGAYWDHYYHSRPFYAERQQWEARAIRVRAPSRPTSVANISSHPTDTRTQTQERRATTTGTAQQRTAVPATTAAPERTTTAPEHTTTERSSNEARTAKLAHPESRPVPEPQAKPESAPAPAKPTDMPERMKPVEHPVQPTQAPKPIASAKRQNEERKASEPKPKDELKPEKKKDDSGGGGDSGGH
jgi:uncharacterized protein YraI